MSKFHRKSEKNVDQMNNENSKIERDLDGLMASVGVEPSQVRRHSTKARPQSADEDIKDGRVVPSSKALFDDVIARGRARLAGSLAIR